MRIHSYNGSLGFPFSLSLSLTHTLPLRRFSLFLSRSLVNHLLMTALLRFSNSIYAVMTLTLVLEPFPIKVDFCTNNSFYLVSSTTTTTTFTISN